MRLWHKELIPYLPRQQLLGQWRECCCIAKNIAEKGTPNHILVNKIMCYPLNHFCEYTNLVIKEMTKRGYKFEREKFDRWIEAADNDPFIVSDVSFYELFNDWHDFQYLMQCYFNLQEKYECGGISDEAWDRVCDVIGMDLFFQREGLNNIKTYRR